MEDFGFVRAASLTVAWVLCILAAWGIYSFFPKKSDRADTGPAWLILAIWTGFLGVGLNSLYWRAGGDLITYFEFVSLETFRSFGNTYGDIVWKGLGVMSIYLHFYSHWKFLNPLERKKYRPLSMGFYPNETHWAVKASLALHRLNPCRNRTKD